MGTPVCVVDTASRTGVYLTPVGMVIRWLQEPGLGQERESLARAARERCAACRLYRTMLRHAVVQ